MITTGEGGMVVTSKKNIAKKLQLLKNLSFTKKRFIHRELGFNYRMTNICAAIGLAQLQDINRFIQLRRKHAFLYNKLLKDVDWIATPIEREYAKNVYWMYGIRLRASAKSKKTKLMAYLKSKGIDTRSYFIGMHRQPMFKGMGLFKGEKYPVTDKLANTGLYLPSGSGLTDKQVRFVANTLKLFR